MSGDEPDSHDRPPDPPPLVPLPPSRLPADEVATRNVPPPDVPVLPAAPPVTEQHPASAADEASLLPGEQLPTRNVPPRPIAVSVASPEVEEEFVLPQLESMGPATTAMLIGRVLFACAALLIGLAARRSTGIGGAEHASSFWPVAFSAGVLMLVGIGASAYWSATLAGNARRLRARTASAKASGWTWLVPVAWVAFSAVTYLQVDVDAEVDPMPGIAAIGWLIAVIVVYGRLQGVFRGLSRTPPIVWISAFPLDLVAFGLVWWRLTSWPSPIGSATDEVELTANVAFGAAAALLANVFVYAWFAQRAGNGLFERLGRLEALHRPDASEPEWFRHGLAERQALAPPIVSRPLISTEHLSTIVAVLHVAWGLALVAFGAFVGVLALDYSDVPVFLGDDLVIDPVDRDRIVTVATVVGVVYVAALVSHGIWAVLSAINARRVTVHSPNPGTFAIAFAPMPLLLVAGLVIGGNVGYWLVVAGLTIAFAALILVNQMLMALSGRIGGQLLGFSRWTLCLTLTYLAGVVLNILFSQSAAQLGFYATLALVQGALIALGGVIGYSAMRSLEIELQNHRRVRRVDPDRISRSVRPPGIA